MLDKSEFVGGSQNQTQQISPSNHHKLIGVAYIYMVHDEFPHNSDPSTEEAQNHGETLHIHQLTKS